MDSLIVTLAVISVFATFAVVLFWGDRQTATQRKEKTLQIRRRAF
jgi:type II secretory pathway pseudopilin PulG